MTVTGSQSSQSFPDRDQPEVNEVLRVSETLQHLAAALSGHLQRLHFQGVPVPREIEELTNLLRYLARSRQEPPPVALAPGRGHYSPVPDRLLMTKAEAAERLGISIRTVERLVATGRLPQVHVERLARFRVKDLETYVDGLAEARVGTDDDEDREGQTNRTACRILPSA